jgi:hypothetical protein
LTGVKKRWQTITLSYLQQKKVATKDEIWNYLCDQLRPALRPTIRQFHHFLTSTEGIKPLGKSTIREGTYRYEDDSQVI